MVTETSPLGLLRNIGIFVITVVLLWLLGPFSDYFDRHGITIDSTLANVVIALLGVTSALALWFIVEAVFVTPARLDAEARAAVVSMEAQVANLSPRLEVSLERHGELSVIHNGGTNETLGGIRYTHYLGTRHVACLVIRNPGGTVARCCQARLTRIWEFDAPLATEMRVIESVPLGWSRQIEPMVLAVDILPGEAKRLYVAAVRANGGISLWSPLENQPVEYHSLFQVPGNYRLELSIAHDDGPTLVVHLDVTSGTGQPHVAGRPDARAVLELKKVIRVS